MSDIENDINQNSEQAAAFLKALANPFRLQVLCALLSEELSVAEINERVTLSQSALSQHLATLRKNGMVATRRESQTIYYQIADPRVSQMINTLHKLFCQS